MMDCWCMELCDTTKIRMSGIAQRFVHRCEDIIKKYSHMEKDINGTDFSNCDEASKVFDDIAMKMYMDIMGFIPELENTMYTIACIADSGQKDIDKHMREETEGSVSQTKLDIDALVRIGVYKISFYEEMSAKFSDMIKTMSSTNNSIVAIQKKLGLLTECSKDKREE